MTNWCTNRLEIVGPSTQIQEVKALMTGALYPHYKEAINLSIKMFVAGCAGILKPACPVACERFPELTDHGIGTSGAANEAFSEWVALFNNDLELTDENAKLIVAIYARTGLATLAWEALLPEQQLAIQALYKQQYHAWILSSVIAGEWWQQLDEEPQGTPFDMCQLVPTRLSAEINGFSGGFLFATTSAHDLYLDLYGIKWPHAFDCQLEEGVAMADQASLQFDFDTPWGAPESAVLQALSERYQCSVIHYFSEAGEGFCGMSQYVSGKLICEACDFLERGPKDEEGYSEVIGPDYIIDHVPHYGG